MPVSSESDFEHFAQKVREHIRLKVEQTEAQSQEYVHAKERETEQRAATWLKNAETKWEHEYAELHKQGSIDIADGVNKKWARFRRENMLLLEERLRQRLQEIFPVLAECFIAALSTEHDTGTFILPRQYASVVDSGRFDVKISQKDELLFRKGNLYIEYSVERIMVELEEEIAAGMHLEDEIWQG